MRVLVTGSSGFVGSAFREYFESKGYEVTAIDLINNHDCRTFFATNDTRFDLVIHCAAVVGGRTFIDGQPLQLATEDLSIDAAMFNWARRTQPRRVVYFSSSAAYPPHLQAEDRDVKLREDRDFVWGACDQTYGWVKQTGERLALELNKLDIRTFVFRPFSGYGNHQTMDYPFPSFVQRAVERQDPFEFWGKATSTRDWVHIDDIVGAVVAALDHGVTGPVNICTGRAISFSNLAAMMARRVGYTVYRMEEVVGSPMGVHNRVGDPTLLEQFYVPRIVLEEGIARALAPFL